LLQSLLGLNQQGGQPNTVAGRMGALGPKGGPNPASWAPSNDPGQRLENVFGSLAPQGIQQFLSQPTPEQRALNTALPNLQETLSGGASPQFNQDLSLANQQGGRFGSANEILRGQALTGLWNQRNQAAQTLGMLSSAAGQGQQRQAGFMDMETQRRLQLLMSLLGTSQSASFNLPFVAQPSVLDTLGQVGGLVAGAAGIPGLGGGGGGGGTVPGPGTVNTVPRGS